MSRAPRQRPRLRPTRLGRVDVHHPTYDVWPCARCGGEFRPSASGITRSYCPGCSKEYGRNWFANNAKRSRTCEQCSQEFITEKYHQQFCSDDCRYRCPACQPERNVGIKKFCDECRRPSRTCFHCGEKFNSGLGKKKYCSERCKYQAREDRRNGFTKRPTTSVCEWCYREFPYRLNKSVCSSQCRAALNWHLEQYAAPDRCHLPVCRDCRVVFSANRRSVIASKSRCKVCQTLHQRIKDRARYKERDARRRGAKRIGDRIDAVVLAERDGWMCHLCQEPINPNHSWPNPASLTIDHLIPITPRNPTDEPGSHTWDNVKAAHLSCNTGRSNKPLGVAS